MSSSVVSIIPVLTLLNEAAQADRHAITVLLDSQVPASPELVNHSVIQISNDQDGNPQIGVLGLLNGVIETLTGKRVVAVYEEDDGFTWVSGFVEWQPSVVTPISSEC